jgi:hypothetical protein
MMLKSPLNWVYNLNYSNFCHNESLGNSLMDLKFMLTTVLSFGYHCCIRMLAFYNLSELIIVSLSVQSSKVTATDLFIL